MSTATVWESGLTCDAAGCGGEFVLGEEILWWYGRKLHQACAAADAASRRAASGEDGDVMEAARALLAAGSRVILTRRQLRALVALAVQSGVELVRKPDVGTGRQQWYGRMAGWSAARVAAGLTAAEVAGMWADFLDVGRMPPLRQDDLAAIVGAIETEIAALSLPPRDAGSCRIRDLSPEGTGPRDGGHPMTDRSEIVRAIAAAHAAQDGEALTRAVAALDSHDKHRAREAAASRELDLGARFAAERLTPVPLHELHTAATDWLAGAETPDDGSWRTAMIAEASVWYRNLDQAVRGDAEELAVQAAGRAGTLASAHGINATAARREFLQVIAYLHSTQAASGLPQIDQTIDPNNAPAPTPYPTQVFDNFANETDPFNGTETNAHGSGAASEGAPMIQQIRQQNGGGSGYGSGPEKPSEHDTGFDTSHSYAEVPLGIPGAIPADPGSQISAPSTPNPATGAGPQVAGGQPPEDQQRTAAVIEGYSLPDPFGYRWTTAPEIMHPFHERCASAHWPDESCGDRAHTASVAVGYSMDLDTARRLASCEQVGAQEGLRAYHAARSVADLAAHHNRITAAWGGSDRTAEDTAVLHGFMAVVRPVLADLAPVEARDFTEKRRKQDAAKGDALPGGKLPVEDEQDLENAEHLKGKVKGVPKAEVDSYMRKKEEEFGHKHSSAPGREPNFKEGASGLDQIQQVTDPNNVQSPGDDQLPDGVAFPIDPAFAAQWVTGPGGAQPSQGGQHEAARTRGLPQAAAAQWGYAHATEGRAPMHQAEWQYSLQRHGDYLRSYNQTAGLIHGMVGKAPMSKTEYAEATGRPDLHNHYLEAYAQGRARHSSQLGPYGESTPDLRATSRLVQADAWSQPRQSTDDLAAPYNSPETTPPMTQGNGDYAAGKKAGQADRAAGQRPAFADNSSAVSPYVKGYTEGYCAAPQPSGTPDVPYSMGGDSGQAQNAQQAAQSFQVARASRRRVSAAFAPDQLLADPEFRKGYLFASRWKPGQRLVSQGSAKFEAGMYAGVTDRPQIQPAWTESHIRLASRHPDLRRRLELHRSFSRKAVRKNTGMRMIAGYLRQAGVSTDLITDGPGTSPDPMGATPINGPGTSPEMAGRSDPAKPGGAPPYQGAPPLPGGPVVSDDVMGRAQEDSQSSGPFTQTFSGTHPENADLAPVADNRANKPGYSNKNAYQGDPYGGDRVARLAAFRRTVQANLAGMGVQQ